MKNLVAIVVGVAILGWASWFGYNHLTHKEVTAVKCPCCSHCACGKTDCKGSCCADKKCCEACGCTEAGCCSKAACSIPPCGCGCMENGQCKCKNCAERTADPSWKK